VAISRQNPFRPALVDWERLTFKNNCVKSKKHKHILSAAET